MWDFDEAIYLETHPDVAEAVRRGDWPSGLMHYCANGKARGRKAAAAVDAEWYLSAYPQAAFDVAAGTAASAAEHYERCGQYRGYLPSARARRPGVRSHPASAAGLWTDAGNAPDLIAGRAELGRLAPKQAELLSSWVSAGFVVLPNAIAEPTLAAAEAEVERAHCGDLPGVVLAADPASGGAAALDLHWVSAAVRQVLFARNVLAFLHLIFERRVLASESLAPCTQGVVPPYQDAAYRSYSLPRHFVGCAIALADGAAGGGIQCYAGSHRMAEYLYRNEFEGAAEAQRLNPGIDIESERRRHHDLVERQLAGLGLAPTEFRAQRGDVLLWNASLAHGVGSGGESPPKTLVAYYCPAEVAPHYFETQPQRSLKSFAATAFYSSRYRTVD